MIPESSNSGISVNRNIYSGLLHQRNDEEAPHLDIIGESLPNVGIGSIDAKVGLIHMSALGAFPFPLQEIQNIPKDGLPQAFLDVSNGDKS